VRNLFVPDPNEHLRYVIDAVSQIRKALDNRVPLIGFSGSPYTLACYMVEGGASDDFRLIKTMMYSRPELLHAILDVNARAVTEYLNAQVEAGAQALMIFDTWGGSLSASAYREYSLEYMQRILSELDRTRNGEVIPRIVFTKGGGVWLEDIAAIGADAVGLDWTVNIGEARRRTRDGGALQGNLDPAVLFGAPERIRAEVQEVLAAYGAGSGHVFNLGHGISQHTDPEQVGVLVDAVHELSCAFH
jgi:uroporphyrinogen decarboxylase